MGQTGGAAVAIGIWYQSIGAATALVNRWKFGGGSEQGECESVLDDGLRQLLLEYFDMDAAIRTARGLGLIQFKVSMQLPPPRFGRDEVRQILRTATETIINHERQPPDPTNGEPLTSIIGFIVASNRPSDGCFAELEAAVSKAKRSISFEIGSTHFFDAFASAEAPIELFPRDKQSKNITRTMEDLARSIVHPKTNNGRVAACLKAMSCFAFASAHPAQLDRKLRQWFRTWGILPSEDDVYITRILGVLQSQSLSGEACDEQSIMGGALGSYAAVPLTSSVVWSSAIDELCNRNWLEPPTPDLMRCDGLEDWMLDRSRLLQGLPFRTPESMTPDLDPESLAQRGVGVAPRIFILVGPGGAGKTALMTKLLGNVAGAMWDWRAKRIREIDRFRGFPIIASAATNALDAIEGALMRWGKRQESVNQADRRFANAYGVSDLEPAVWLGIDGLDEAPSDKLRDLARAIANAAKNQPNVRFVLTCRPLQFERIKQDLNSDWLLYSLQIVDFDEEEARLAVLRATEDGLVLRPRASDYLLPGQSAEMASTFDFDESVGAFEASFRQPLFVGVIRRLYKSGKLEKIQGAYDGNEEASREVLSQYVYDYCERAARRFDNDLVNARQFFRALKRLSNEVENPEGATISNWVSISERELSCEVSWQRLYAQCAASGFIIGSEAGAFKWRHLLASRFLPEMEENPQWR